MATLQLRLSRQQASPACPDSRSIKRSTDKGYTGHCRAFLPSPRCCRPSHPLCRACIARTRTMLGAGRAVREAPSRRAAGRWAPLGIGRRTLGRASERNQAFYPLTVDPDHDLPPQRYNAYVLCRWGGRAHANHLATTIPANRAKAAIPMKVIRAAASSSALEGLSRNGSLMGGGAGRGSEGSGSSMRSEGASLLHPRHAFTRQLGPCVALAVALSSCEDA